MKVIVPTNTIPNSILIQDIDPSQGIVIVYKDQMPYGFVVYNEVYGLYLLQTNTTEPTGLSASTLASLLGIIQKHISGDISLEYFKTENE